MTVPTFAPLPSADAPAGAPTAPIVLDNVSRFYGPVVAVNKITFALGPGITGLLGPNGAGKTTILHMLSGLLQPSNGRVLVGGLAAWRNPAVYRSVGLVPEREAVQAFLTGREFVEMAARLHELPDPRAAADQAIRTVDLQSAADRAVGGLIELDGRDRPRGRGRRIGQALETRGELDELAAGEERVDRLALRDEAQVTVDRGITPGRPTADQHAPGRRPEEPREEVQDRRLAGSVRAQQTGDPRPEAEADVVDGDDVAVPA